MSVRGTKCTLLENYKIVAPGKKNRYFRKLSWWLLLKGPACIGGLNPVTVTKFTVFGHIVYQSIQCYIMVHGSWRS